MPERCGIPAVILKFATDKRLAFKIELSSVGWISLESLSVYGIPCVRNPVGGFPCTRVG